MRFSRQGYWGGLPFPSPEDLPNSGIESGSPVLQADSLPTELQGKPILWIILEFKSYFLHKNTNTLVLLSTLTTLKEEKWGWICISLFWGVGFPGGVSGKEPACQCRRHKRRERCWVDPWAGKIHWRRAWHSTPVFLPGETHGRRSLEGYNP